MWAGLTTSSLKLRPSGVSRRQSNHFVLQHRLGKSTTAGEGKVPRKSQGSFDISPRLPRIPLSTFCGEERVPTRNPAAWAKVINDRYIHCSHPVFLQSSDTWVNSQPCLSCSLTLWRPRIGLTMSPKSSLDKEAALGHVENLDGVPQVIEIDGFRVLGLSPEDADFYRNFSEERRKKVLRKVSKP